MILTRFPSGSIRGIPSASAIAVAILLPCGCTVYRPVILRPPTLGEELIQLDAARRDGLLTGAEYETRRAEAIAAWKRIGEAPIEPVPAPANAPAAP
ncbi:MAG: hypothetical protein ACKOJI_00090 [Phycisphaerales bacterium]